MLALRDLRGLIVIDEVQRRPELFPILRVLADRREVPARFLVLGSASPELLQQTSESLAGRIFYHDLGGFDLDEVGVSSYERLWLRGGFPRSFLADRTAPAPSGAGASSAPFSNGTFPTSESRFPPRRSGASGR